MVKREDPEESAYAVREAVAYAAESTRHYLLPRIGLDINDKTNSELRRVFEQE